MTFQRFYRIGEVAQLWGVHQRTVNRWAEKRIIPSEPTASGRRLFPADEIDAMVNPAMSGERPGMAALEKVIRDHYGSRPTEALLDLAELLSIDVAYLDCDRFAEYLKKRYDHDLTTGEWKRVAAELGEFCNVVDECCKETISAYMDHVISAARVTPKSTADVEEIVRLYVEEKLSVRAIATRVGFSYGKVYNILDKRITMRNPAFKSRGRNIDNNKN